MPIPSKQGFGELTLSGEYLVDVIVTYFVISVINIFHSFKTNSKGHWEFEVFQVSFVSFYAGLVWVLDFVSYEDNMNKESNCKETINDKWQKIFKSGHSKLSVESVELFVTNVKKVHMSKYK